MYCILCHSCHTIFFSLKPKLGIHFLILFSCKSSHIWCIHIEVKGLIHPPLGNFRSGYYHPENDKNWRSHLPHIWGSNHLHVVKIGKSCFSQLKFLYMNNKCHQYQSHQNSDAKEIEQKKSDLRVPMSHMSHWNHPYSQNRHRHLRAT